MSLREDITEPFRVWRLAIPPYVHSPPPSLPFSGHLLNFITGPFSHINSKHSRELLALDIRYDQFLPEFPAINELKDMLATNETLSSDLSHLFHKLVTYH